MKRRVAFVVSTLECCGPTNQLFNIIYFLNRDLFSITLITLSKEPLNSDLSEFKKLGINIVCSQLSSHLNLKKARTFLSDKISLLEPHLIHSQGLRPDILVASLNTNAKKISTLRNFPQHDFAPQYGRMVAFFFMFLLRFSFKRIDTVVGVSKAVSLNIEKLFSLRNVVTIQNGVDLNKYKFRVTHPLPPVYKHIKLDGDSKIFIASGGLIDRKDPLGLIRVWLSITRDNPNLHLIVIGDGPLLDACVSLGAEGKNVYVLGDVKDVPAYLASSDYYVSHSKAEGLPNAALEALASGLPVVLSDIDPHKELLEKLPGCGVVYNPSEKGSLASKVAWIITKGNTTSRKMIAASASSSFSAKSMSEQYSHLYKEVCSKQTNV